MLGRAIVTKVIKNKNAEYLEVMEMKGKVITPKKILNRSGKIFHAGDTVVYKIGLGTIIVQNLFFLVAPIAFFILTFFILFLASYSEGQAILISFLVLALSASFFFILSKTFFKHFFMPCV